MKPGDHLPAGDLNQLIALYAPQMNAGGDEITGSALTASGIPASKRGLRGRELEAGDRTTGEQWAEFRIRWRKGLDTATTLTHGGDKWNIEAADNVNGSNRVLAITARLVR